MSLGGGDVIFSSVVEGLEDFLGVILVIGDDSSF